MLPLYLAMPVYSGCCMYVEDDLLVVHLNKTSLKYRVAQAEEWVRSVEAARRRMS